MESDPTEHTVEASKITAQEYLDQKEKSHQLKIQEFHQEIKDILTGKHIGYRNALELLEMEHEDAIQRAEMFYEYELECAERIYELEKNHSLNEFKSDFEGLQEEMLERLDEKKRKLQEDYESFDLANDSNIDGVKPIGTRKAARLAVKAEERRERKSKKQQGATLTFLLNENDVYDDLTILRRNNPNLRTQQKMYKGRI